MKTEISGREKIKADETLGAIIRKARQHAGLTQDELAQVANLPRYWLGRWERGRSLPTAAEWYKLAIVLKLPSQPLVIK